jgi:hypothetical protein
MLKVSTNLKLLKKKKKRSLHLFTGVMSCGVHRQCFILHTLVTPLIVQ